jgi:hypothetical protein
MNNLQWDDVINIIRDYDRRLVVLFHQAECLSDPDRRKELLLQKALGR